MEKFVHILTLVYLMHFLSSLVLLDLSDMLLIKRDSENPSIVHHGKKFLMENKNLKDKIFSVYFS